MHVVQIAVSIDPSRRDEAYRGLVENIVPMTKERPGFVKGTWFGDGEQKGFALITYESQEHAERAASQITAPPDAPMTLDSVAVWAVQAEA